MTEEHALWAKGDWRVVRTSWDGIQAEYIVKPTTRFADLPVGEWDAACGDLESDILQACILDLHAALEQKP